MLATGLAVSGAIAATAAGRVNLRCILHDSGYCRTDIDKDKNLCTGNDCKDQLNSPARYENRATAPVVKQKRLLVCWP